jgi:hypothetical protein
MLYLCGSHHTHSICFVELIQVRAIIFYYDFTILKQIAARENLERRTVLKIESFCFRKEGTNTHDLLTTSRALCGAG